MQQKGKQLEDLWKSNFSKEVINKTLQALKNSAIVSKTRNVLNPENIKAVAAKTYDEVIKGSISKTKTWANEKSNQLLDTPIGNTAFATLGPTGPTTIRDVFEQAKDSFSQIKVNGNGGQGNEKKLEEVGEVIKGTESNKFTYKHNPMNNPKAVKDILENPDAVYGFSPNPKSESIGGFADAIDWTNPEQVAGATARRQGYHDKNDNILELNQFHKSHFSRA